MSGRLSQAAQQRLGLPDRFKLFSSFPFKGLNQSSSRIAIDDQELWWLENLIRVGDGNYRALWDAGTPFYTAPTGKTIISFFWFNIGPQEYVIVFLNDGTATQVAYPLGAQTTVSAQAGTFYQSSNGLLPACVQSGTQYLIISNHNTNNDYWIWDGTILYAAGGIAPFNATELQSGGSGYTSTPSYTVFGGSGFGVVLNPVVVEGSVVALTVVHPGSGYSPGDVVQVAFQGGGSDTSPQLVALLTGGAIGHITLLAGGSGYTPGTYPLGISGSGSGASGTFTVNTTSGPVVSIDLSNGGTGFVTGASISFPGAGGTGASAAAFINQSGVSSITVVDGGSGLQGTPTLTIVGGGGTGATAVATVSGGTITGATVTASGSGYQSAPAVEVQTGQNNAAAAILDLMPFGVSGTSIETYQSRVWISYPNQQATTPTGGTLFVSAPQSLTDFATSAGGDIFTNTDRFLRSQYTFLRQTSNFLYAMGDSSVSVISNVQTGGNPTATTFSYQNSDPQIGSSWRDSAQDYSNTILFANALGVYGIYGGSVRKVSKKIDNLFTNAILPANGGLTPTAATANIYSQKVYLLLMTITDPFTFQPRVVMIGWDEQEWFVAHQSPNLIYLGTQEINSNLTAWGTDGNSLYPLFNKASSSLVKTFSTKQWGANQPHMIKMAHSIYLDAEDLSTGQVGISFNGSMDAVGTAYLTENTVMKAVASVPSVSYPFGATLTFNAPKGLGAVYAFGVGAAAMQVPGMELGITIASSSPDFSVRNISLGYIEQSAVA
jgi:hypothetical protein